MSEEAQKKSVINRGGMIMQLRPGRNGDKRVLHPGKSIECLDEKEFAFLTGYKHIADVEKIAPQVAQNMNDLRAKLAKAETENARLKAAQAASEELPASYSEPREEKKSVKKKGK